MYQMLARAFNPKFVVTHDSHRKRVTEIELAAIATQVIPVVDLSRHEPKLGYIDLSYIADAMKKNPKATILDFSHNLGDEDTIKDLVELISKVPHLSKVIIHGIALTPAAKARLTQALLKRLQAKLPPIEIEGLDELNFTFPWLLHGATPFDPMVLPANLAEHIGLILNGTNPVVRGAETAAAGTELVASGINPAVKSLVRLSFRKQDLPEDVVKQIAIFVANTETLVSLDLTQTNLNAAKMELLAPSLQTHRTITSLLLAGNPLLDSGIEFVAAILQANSILRTVNISSCRFTGDGAIALSGALVPQGVKSNASVVTVVNSTAAVSAAAKGNAPVKKDVKTEVDIKSMDMAATSAVNRNSLELYMDGNLIGDEGAESIAYQILQGSSRLDALFIGACGITQADTMTCFITAVASNSALKALGIGANVWSDESALALAKFLASPQCALGELSIAGQFVGSKKGINALANGIAANQTLTAITFPTGTHDNAMKLDNATQVEFLWALKRNPNITSCNIEIFSTNLQPLAEEFLQRNRTRLLAWQLTSLTAAHMGANKHAPTKMLSIIALLPEIISQLEEPPRGHNAVARAATTPKVLNVGALTQSRFFGALFHEKDSAVSSKNAHATAAAATAVGRQKPEVAGNASSAATVAAASAPRSSRSSKRKVG